MVRRKRNILSRISAVTAGVLLAAQCFTAFADTALISGDVNADGKLDVSDVVAVAAHVKSVKMLDKDQSFIADVNSDGVVNVSDVAIMAAHIKGVKSMPKVTKLYLNRIAALDEAALRWASNGKLVSLNTHRNDSEPDKTVYEVIVTNAETGEVERSIKEDSHIDIIGMKKDGTLITYKYRDDDCTDICLFAPGKDEPEVIKTDLCYPGLGYDEETDEIYITCDNGLRRVTADGKLEDITDSVIRDINDVTQVSLEKAMAGFIHRTGDSPDLWDVSVVSMETGEELWKTVTHNGSVYFTKSNTLVTDGHSENDTTLRCYDTKSGELLGLYELDSGDPMVIESPRSNKCVFRDQSHRLVVFDTATGGIAYIDPGMKNMRVLDCDFLDEDTMVFDAVYRSGDFFVTETFIIDLGLIEFTQLPEGKNVEEMDEYKPKQPGAALAEQRKKADELEDKYGVHILIGDEVLNVANSTSRTWTSMESMDDWVCVEETKRALFDLEKWLSAYPEGFFEKFKTAENPEGYRVVLIDDFYQNEEILFGLEGMALENICTIDVVIVARIYDFSSCMDHETWHAVEMLIDHKDSFDDDEWAKLNPEDFEYYSGDYSIGDTPQGEMYEKYLSECYSDNKNYENGYFIRDYSENAPKEDRATILEFLNPADVNNVFYDMDEELAKYSHIKAKLDYMGKWIEPYFGYIYWEEMIKNKAVSKPGEAVG
ncbi:dockerin type I domain-containing protein [uncultured Ruminococcus sp.]|uniref:dockerin type I domain-containing protein n=1 Tax=uncultured Ruminococcus sp. TaxID=165186 RepID=UPI0025E658A3|nr:dockerin type I domain-containing protein [uncultured Ruminococcus sp.]